MVAESPNEDEIEKVWRKARPFPGQDPDLYRIAPDIIQSVIRRDRHDICDDHGWRIERGRPVAYRRPSIEDAMTLLQRETYLLRAPTQTQKIKRRKT
jgi:hypothetical protein